MQEFDVFFFAFAFFWKNGILYQHFWLREGSMGEGFEGSMLNITLTNFISYLKSYSLCIGITALDSQQAMSMTKRVISKKFNFTEYQTLQSQSPCNQIFYFWSNTCELLLSDGKTVCKDCNALKQRTVSERTWKSKKGSEPKAPITLTSPERLEVNSGTLFFK